MRTFFVSIVVLTITSCTEITVDCETLNFEERIAYFNNKRFSGKCTLMKDSVLVEIQSYKHGERSGKWVGYYPNGSVEYQGMCSENEIHGNYTKFYPNGAIMLKAKFRKGFKTGRWIYKDSLGNVLKVEDYSEKTK